MNLLLTSVELKNFELTRASAVYLSLGICPDIELTVEAYLQLYDCSNQSTSVFFHIVDKSIKTLYHAH